MMLHPGILALVAGSCVVLFLGIYASIAGVRIAARWNFGSSSEEQLGLERKTTLLAAVMKYALGFEAASVVLFLYTLEDIHGLFAGAMCATGSLNANPVGWWALYGKIALLFLSSLWVAVNYIDETAEDYPLVRFKCAALPVITGLIGVELLLLISYFGGLHPEVITSCCGSLFSEDGSGVASEIAALPAGQMKAVFFGLALVVTAFGLLCLKTRSGPARYGYSFLSALFFFVSVAAVISFISLHIYELPTHHCPFDILQGNYHYIGYPLFLSLFTAVFFALLPGIFYPLKRWKPSLAPGIGKAERGWTVLALSGMAVFLVLSSWPVFFGNLVL